MSDVTHGLCKKCSQMQPIIWSGFVQETISGTLSRRFEGMEAKCEVCNFEIARLGRLDPVRDIAP